MLNQLLSQTLEDLKAYREEHRDESRELESRLNCLVFDIRCLIHTLKESDVKKVA